MNPKASALQTKRIETAISRIGAKAAEALERSYRAKELSAESVTLLIEVQVALEELYLSLRNTSEPLMLARDA